MAKKVIIDDDAQASSALGAGLWDRVVEAASKTIGGRARTGWFDFISFDGHTLRLKVKDAHEDARQYLTENIHKTAELVKQTTGHDVNVILEPENSTNQYQRLATSLSDRLRELETKLKKRVAQVEAEANFLGRERSHRLCWRRQAGEWCLYVWDVPRDDKEAYEVGGGEPVTGFNGRFLLKSSVEDKVAAAEAIPALLKAIEAAEVRRVERLKNAHEILDAAVRALETPEGA